MKGNRVVVTGMGAVTPLGLDVDSSWAGICDGRSGAAAIEQFDAATFSTRFSASVKNLALRDTSRLAMPGGWTRSFSTAWWLAFKAFRSLWI
jgi:3-oxoacyl-(acyl-carrier-protein) synthase